MLSFTPGTASATNWPAWRGVSRSVPPVTDATPCGLSGQLRLLLSNDSSRTARGPAAEGPAVGCGAAVGWTRGADVGAVVGCACGAAGATVATWPGAPAVAT